MSPENFCVHPDMQEAYSDYKGKGDSFKRVFRKRDEKIKKGEKYWDDTYDEEYKRKARENNKKIR